MEIFPECKGWYCQQFFSKSFLPKRSSALKCPAVPSSNWSPCYILRLHMLFSHCLCHFDGSPVFQAKISLLFLILSRHTALSFSRKITSALDFQSEPWYNNHVSNRIVESNYSLSELSKCQRVMLLALFYLYSFAAVWLQSTH